MAIQKLGSDQSSLFRSRWSHFLSKLRDLRPPETECVIGLGFGQESFLLGDPEKAKCQVTSKIALGTKLAQQRSRGFVPRLIVEIESNQMMGHSPDCAPTLDRAPIGVQF